MRVSQVVLVVKNLPSSAGDVRNVGSIPGLGRSPGVGNGNPLQYSCMENSMVRGVWWAAVCGITKSQTQLKRLSTNKSFLTEIQDHIKTMTQFFFWQLEGIDFLYCIYFKISFFQLSFNCHLYCHYWTKDERSLNIKYVRDTKWKEKMGHIPECKFLLFWGSRNWPLFLKKWK